MQGITNSNLKTSLLTGTTRSARAMEADTVLCIAMMHGSEASHTWARQQ
jgi:hypothetical protein